jgi:hypothetical protein
MTVSGPNWRRTAIALALAAMAAPAMAVAAPPNVCLAGFHVPSAGATGQTATSAGY